MKIKCGITGSTGNLGRYILKSDKFIFIRFRGDITKPKEVDSWVKQNNFDLIIHLAAIVPIKKVSKNLKYSTKVNVDGTLNLIKAINKFKRKLIWFFYASTSHVYSYSKYKINENNPTRPISEYGKTKLMAEKVIKKYLNKEINCTIGRIFSFTSKYQDNSFFIPGILQKISSKKIKYLKFNDVNHFRDFINIQSVVDIIFFLFFKRYNGIINIASGNKTSLKNIIIKLNNKKHRLSFNNTKSEKSQFASIKKLRKCGYKRKILSWDV